MRIRLLVVIAACGALAACGGHDSSPAKPTTTPTDARPAPTTVRTLAGGVTTLRLDAGVRKIFRYVGLTLVGTGKASGSDGSLRFPVTGGRLTPGPLRGTVEHAGTLRISANGKRVDVTELQIDLAQDVVTGVVRGKRVPVLRVDVGEPRTLAPPGRPFQLSGDAAVVGDRLVTALGRDLGVDILRAGLPLGRLQISVY